MSIHGHKDFTAWGWEIRGEPAIDQESGEKIKQEEIKNNERFIGSKFTLLRRPAQPSISLPRLYILDASV
jgi:hypothetical protein